MTKPHPRSRVLALLGWLASAAATPHPFPTMRSSLVLALLPAVSLGAPAIASGAAPAIARPNVVILITDDQGTLDANCYGSTDLLLGNWIFRGIGSGRGLRGGCRVKAESDPYSPPTLKSA